MAKQPEPEPPPKVTKTRVTFIAVGDIMMSRGVAKKIFAAKDPLLPFSKFAERLKSTDFNFANLESPFSGSDKVASSGSLVFNTPDNFVTGLKEYNFKVITLANNHALDQGFKGVKYTRQHLTDNELIVTGTGEDLTQAWQPAFIKVKGVKIAFIGSSYASINDGGIARNDYVARIEDTDSLKKSIETAKKEADFVIATMHAGIEDTYKPHKPQEDFAHTAIDLGADLVIGHHPHWIQTVEKYKERYIFYSLGNFIFDQRNPNNKEGLTLKITLQNTKTETKKNTKSETIIEEIELIPVVIENFSTPREAKEEEAKKILAKIDISERFIKHMSEEKVKSEDSKQSIKSIHQ
ncbi:MAG: CapA family protein [Blastocatellia bacterium]|nr:CapA family protein [Blastocatellia bacterium]